MRSEVANDNASREEEEEIQRITSRSPPGRVEPVVVEDGNRLSCHYLGVMMDGKEDCGETTLCRFMLYRQRTIASLGVRQIAIGRML